MSIGQPAGSWSGVCSGLEGDMVQMAVSAWREKGARAVDAAQRSQAPMTFRCDWCKQTVDRSLNVGTTDMDWMNYSSLNSAISAGDKCCAGMWWHEDGDEIELCCLCFHVPDPGFALVFPHTLLMEFLHKLLVPAEFPLELAHAESSPTLLYSATHRHM